MNLQRMLLLVLMIFTMCIVSAVIVNAQEINLTFEGHYGGAVYASDVTGNYLYMGQGQDFVVIDVSNSASPVQLGKVSTGSLLNDIKLFGSYAYAAGVNGLVILDISDPTTPTFAGSYDTAYNAYGVAVSGSHAYVADYYGGLVILDISDPTAPTFAGSYDTAGFAYGIAVNGSHAYIADEYNGLVILDISNPTAPTFTGSYYTPGNDARGVAVSGSHAYVADRHNSLVIIDISDPTAPTFAGSCYTPGDARGVAVSGSHAYVADSHNGLVILDISNPTAPTFAGSYDTAGDAYNVAVSGSHVYVADGSNGLAIIDISDPTAPTFAGSYDTAGNAWEVAVSGSYAYVADGSNGLVILNISDPTSPSIAGSYDTANFAYEVAVSGSHAYVADGYDGLVILDISNPTSPTFAGSYDTADNAWKVAVSGSHAYIADGYTGLVILNISNPFAPTFAGSYNTADYAFGVAVIGSHAYIADTYNGLVILDISDPTAPAFAGSYDTAGNACGIIVSGSHAYIADGSNGLVILTTDALSTSGPVHNINKCTNYTTIQAAIEDASPGDEIHVDSGTYYENVVVNKQLILRGIDTGTGMPVVDAGGSGSAITLSADGITLEGFNATNSSNAWFENAEIWVTSNYNTVLGNIANNNYNVGIFLSSSSNNDLISNTVTNTARVGILLYRSNNNNLISNTVSYSGIGIWVYDSSNNNNLTDNKVNNNYYKGLHVYGSNNNILTGNNADKNGQIGIDLHGSSYNTLNNNTANNNGYKGIEIYNPTSTNNILINNIANNNSWTGITLRETLGNNVITGNTVNNNNEYGIDLGSAGSNNVLNNNIANNNKKYGIFIHFSSNNLLYNNSMSNNAINNAYDQNSNQWDNGTIGNHYSNFDEPAEGCIDIDNNNICDLIYNIPGGSSVDNYPLMTPYSPPPPPSGFTVGQGAPTPEIEQLFIDAYNRSGGVSILGDPATEVHDAWGYLVQDFPGVLGIPGGVIMYNDIKDDAFYIHGAIWDKYYTFPDKEELGPVADDERDAATSPQGTTGRYSKFEHGTIHWISDDNADHLNKGESFVTYGDLDKIHTDMGGTASWLGFPVMDQENRGGYGYCEFEGGYIEWDGSSGVYIAKPKQLSVQITSPNNNDIFSKSQTITYRAEVSGGTPDFKYIWIIDSNPNAHIEQKSERISEWSFPASLVDVGDHTVKLKVIDSRVNSVETNIINFKVVTKKIAIIPLEFIDLPHQTPTTNLQTKADLVSSYYLSQSYGQEYIEFELFENNSNDGWYHISENYENIKNEAYGKVSCSGASDYWWYTWCLAMEEASLEKVLDNQPRLIDYDGSMVVIPIMNERPMGQTGGGATWVDTTRGYGSWAHEIGHASFGFSDLANSDVSLDFVLDKVNDIHKWGLMGTGWNLNPPAPITLYNKMNANWIEFDWISANDFGTYSIRQINDHVILEEGGLAYKTESGNYYIFEGRFPDDGVTPEVGFNINTLENTEGIELYQVEPNKVSILADPNALLGLTTKSNRVSMIPGETRYIDGYKVKLTVLKENDEIKINIEESNPINVVVWKMESSIIISPMPISLLEIAHAPDDSYLDIDLIVISQEGKVGMDYTKGKYVNEIEGAHASGNFLGGGFEWISVPINIDAEAFIDLTPELKELIRNDNSINIEIIATMTTYDESGNIKESVPINMKFNSENVDNPLRVSLPINITFLPPITTMDQFNLTDGSTLPIKFTAKNSSTNEFIYDDTVNVTITNSTGHLITYFTNGTGTDSVRINSEEEQYIANFHTKDYAINIGETYSVTVTFWEPDSLRGYDITYFTLIEGGKAKGKGN